MAYRSYRKRSRGSGRKRSSSRRYQSYGSERARQHIREAEEFSAELGGLDRDVKNYFFNLPATELDAVLRDYGRAYGAEKEEYARLTFRKWRSGSTKMSGMVAKRLFAFLPPRMPLRTKYELAGNVWRHFGPSSQHYFRVGPEALLDTVCDAVLGRLDEAVRSYNTPENVRRRFAWLSGNDIELQEQLLNHFRNEEKGLALQKLRHELPVLQKQIREHPGTTGKASSVLQINKHVITVNVEAELVDGLKEGRPFQARPQASQSGQSGQKSETNWGLVFFVGVIILMLLASAGAFG